MTQDESDDARRESAQEDSALAKALERAKPASISPVKVEGEDILKYGIYLAWGVLGAIFVVCIALIVSVAIAEFAKPSSDVAAVQGMLQSAATRDCAASTPDCLKDVEALLGQLATARRAQRDFWTSLTQALLLNLFLPILTSILGYVYGSRLARGES